MYWCYFGGKAYLVLPQELFGRAARVIWPGGKCCLAGRQELFGRAVSVI